MRNTAFGRDAILMSRAREHAQPLQLARVLTNCLIFESWHLFLLHVCFCSRKGGPRSVRTASQAAHGPPGSPPRVATTFRDLFCSISFTFRCQAGINRSLPSSFRDCGGQHTARAAQGLQRIDLSWWGQCRGAVWVLDVVQQVGAFVDISLHWTNARVHQEAYSSIGRA